MTMRLLLPALVAAALWGVAGTMASHLATARATPPAAPAPSLRLPADAWSRGPASLSVTLRNTASSDHLMIERIAPAPAPAGLAAVDIALSGAEPAVVAAIARIEGARPLVRFTRWRLARTAGTGAVRLTACAVAPWR